MANQNVTLYPQMSGKGPFTVEASGYTKVEGESIPRRHPISKEKLVTTPADDVRTIYDILQRSADKFGNAKALGSRKHVKTHVEKKKIKKNVDGQMQEVEKEWTYQELGPYDYLSFVEYRRFVLQLGSGLRKIGMQKGDRVELFAATHSSWLGLSHAAVSQSMPIATAYDTLGEQGLRHSLVQTHARAVYCDPHLLKVVGKTLGDATDVTYVIYNQDVGEVKPADIEKLKTDFPRLTVLSVEELRQAGEANMVDPVPPSPEDLCCIMYTSGSTGPPKGVPIKHKAVLASIAGVTTIVGQYLGPGDGLLTYLPLAHILEFVFENACLFWGGTMGYGSPRTLSDTSVRNCKGDIREFRPTVLVGVPAVWESVRKGIVAKVDQGSAVLRSLFWGALSTKSFLMGSGLPGSGVLDAVVFKKIRDATGGRVKICMNGGGPIAQDTQRFVSMAIAPMINGYGLTETTAMGGLNDPRHWTCAALGDIPSSIELKLVDFPDAGYYSANDPPQGEIWIRGDPVMSGYYDNEEETKETITEDGWFKTGDIGEFDRHGHLRLIDRKKNLVKMQHGEYIALEKLESVYRSAKVVGNICVHASPEKSKPIAIIVPVEAVLQKMAEQQGIKDKAHEELVHDKKMKGAVLKELQAAGKAGGLSGIETIDGVVLADEEWTAANGLVTAAQKLQRKAILNKYKKEVDAAYAGS